MNSFEIIRTIDLFGKAPSLRFEGKDKFRTHCGGLATLVFLILIIAFFVLKSTQVAQGKIKTLTYMIKNTHSLNQTFSKQIRTEEYAFAFNNPQIDLSVIHPSVSLYNQTNKLEDNPLKIFDCSKSVYNRLDTLLKNQISPKIQIFCVKISSNDLLLGRRPVIELRECKDSKKNKKCKSKKEINKLLKKVEVWTFALVDHTDFHLPTHKLTTGFATSKIQVSNTFKKSSNFMLREADIYTKTGSFVNFSPKKRSTLMYLRNDIEIVSTIREHIFLELTITIDQFSKILINKELVTMVNVLATFGGLSKSLAILFLILVFPVREVLYYQRLINDTFNICVDQFQLETAIEIMTKSHHQDGQ